MKKLEIKNQADWFRIAMKARLVIKELVACLPNCLIP
jgi:hypothetical protein